MSEAWDRTNRRYRLVHDVVEEFADTGATSPATRAVIDVVFGDFDAFLLEVQRRWQRSFDARLDLLLEEQPADLAAALYGLVSELRDDLTGTSALLAAHADNPVLAAGEARHRRAVRAATGVDPDAPRADRRCPLVAGHRWWRRRAVALSGKSA